MSLDVQLYTILTMVGGGIWIGIALDTYQRFQTGKKRWNWLRFINDIIFWFLQALIIFYVLLQINQGELRVIIFLALLCGFACYRSLLQSAYKKLLEIIISVVVWIGKMIKNIFYAFFIQPVKLILNLLLSLSKMIGRLLISIPLFIAGIFLFPLKVFGITALFEKVRTKMMTKLKEKAGILKKPTNKVKGWIGKLRR
ncbi:spore cortex biosynthesis protein YabQ [Pseudalkalibacillus salsuginis]|uniref:spore cortex biosynthesis protein YabQ n=1 Tax=Pseudalkalibacillus salsuginis TaxID=2910972 RepID=UPI001F1A1E64|nr:spore cortex biosynthesis protein YabQ [Pseudalkalibacillus salsuginis]MCF6411911.1 spore cortex biosynthesis protein YabQ [Pseudalkalibacillus salsuginis]